MKKDIKFSTRMSSTDREAIKALAKQSGMSMSDYVTACCLGKQVVVIDGLPELTHELKGIGRSVNQLAVLCNMGKLREVHLGETWQALGEIYGKLRELTERETR